HEGERQAVTGAEKGRGAEQGQGVRLVAPEQPGDGLAQKRAVAGQGREDPATAAAVDADQVARGPDRQGQADEAERARFALEEPVGRDVAGAEGEPGVARGETGPREKAGRDGCGQGPRPAGWTSAPSAQ